ncbi:MAG TPA: hypothetical protein VGM67_13445 [Gemmatimonadaceae bacterium]|jgi:hypothetical protein
MRLAPMAVVVLLATSAKLASAQLLGMPVVTGRQPVTPELLRSAFHDSLAHRLLERARAARLAQDSALHSYDAKSYLRFTVGMGVRATSAAKLLLRTEQSARVQWSGGSGISIEPTGRRTAFPLGAGQIDLTNATPIPYFPGRESLWIPASKMGVAQAEVDEREFIHPLATGAEAYYRYASGDSMTIGLPDGRKISVRELRVTPREPNWRAFVGSFWFDTQSGSLVRAAYRISTDLDLWQESNASHDRLVQKLETEARTDTGALAEHERKVAESLHQGPLEKLGIKFIEGSLRPARANLSAVTVTYGLYEGRFWLPSANTAEGEIDAGFMRLPLTWQEKFDYESVNSGQTVVPTPATLGLLPSDTGYAGTASLNIGIDADAHGPIPAPTTPAGKAKQLALEDSLAKRYGVLADSFDLRSTRARAAGDTAEARRLANRALLYHSGAQQLVRRRAGCTSDSSYVAGGGTRYGGAVRTIVRLPCDINRLSSSPDLPGSIYNDDDLFGAADSEALLASLGFSLQPGWAPQWPELNTGLSYFRYNRIEALSLGGSATSALGLGLTAQATARIGTGDRVLNGDLSVSQSSGLNTIRVAAYHRLAVANDDWGAPLSFGASFANALWAHDEGFYYRTTGAEITASREAPAFLGNATLTWRGFAERERSAGVAPNTQASLGNVFGDARFEQNIDAEPLSVYGAGGDVSRTFGTNPEGAQLFARMRGEAAATSGETSVNAGYARLMLDATLSRNVGPFATTITAATGSSAGRVPLQRDFFIGGLQTVRGQVALPDGDGRVGNSFWLGRVEVGSRSLALEPSVFYDAGWAGPRTDLMRAGHPLSGAGVSLSFLDGLFKFDAAHGIWPERHWRFDLSLGPRL